MSDIVYNSLDGLGSPITYSTISAGTTGLQISYYIDRISYPADTYPHQWFTIVPNSQSSTSGGCNINGGSTYNAGVQTYNGGDSTLAPEIDLMQVMYTTFDLPVNGSTISETYSPSCTVNTPADPFLVKVWIATAGYQAFIIATYPAPIEPEPIVCFKEDSQILTDKGYVLVQNLRKGHLVKTKKNGFVPVHSIGKKTINHLAITERIKDQLYKCPKEKFPELFEDLVITGCHSILVDNFTSNEEKERTIQVNGNTYVTDNKYRLPACADEKTVVYEKPGAYTIYHFALENDDYYMNYGVYANGLLVETCSKRYLNELSKMELIE